jgi:selenocysteine lyase/cysteine desulfurase
MTNARAAANARKPYADKIRSMVAESDTMSAHISALTTLNAALLTALKEFVADVDAVGTKEVGKDWPDLLVSYNKARALIAKVPNADNPATPAATDNCQALLESVHEELKNMGFDSDDPIDGGDCCEYLGKLFVDVGEALERDGAKVAA